MNYSAERDTKQLRCFFEIIKYHDNHPHATELYLSDHVLKEYWEKAKDFEQFEKFIKFEIAEYEEYLEWLEDINETYEIERED